MEKKCPFCNGSRIVKCLNLNILPKLVDGSYSLNGLIEKYGEEVPCPECKVSKP